MNENEEFEFALALEAENKAKGAAPAENEKPGGWAGVKDAIFNSPYPSPEELSKKGLGMITNGAVGAQNWLANKTGLPIGTEPTGNMARDVAANVPRIMGETLTETAPKFVSNSSIVTGGLLRAAPIAAKAVAPGAKWLANQAEGASGLVYKGKDLLTEAYKRPGLMFGPGKETANKIYSEIQAGAQQIRPDLKYTAEPIKFIEKAMKAANDGSLSTDEALEARHYLDKIKNTVTGAFYRNARGVLDFIAKQDYSGADQAYQDAVKSEALRSFSAFNKGGTPSVMRNVTTLLKPLAAVAFTPALQSGVASGLGAAARGVQYAANNHAAATSIPGVADKISELMNKKKEKTSGRK